MYVDDISFTNPPTCIKPTGLTAGDITDNSVQLSWTSGSDDFNVQYKKASDIDWIDVSGTVSNPYTLTGLEGNTAYQVRVRTYCSTDDQSDWTDAVSFTTDCGTVTEFPFTETFNNITSGIPDCWNNADGTTTNASFRWNYYATGHDGACLRFNSYSNNNGLTNMLKTPAMNFPTGKTMQLTFWYKNPTGGDFSVFISNDGGATYTTELATGLTGASDWTKKEIVLPDGFTENVVIVFQGTSNYGSGDAYIYLDDVTVKLAPTCIMPTGMTVADITSTGATLSWTSDADDFNVRYKKVDDSEWSEISGTVNAKTYTLTGLTPATNYQAQVRTYCDASDQSDWTDAVLFTTDCVTITEFPFSENFNGISAGIPLCWNNSEGTTTSDNSKFSYYATGYDGACLRFNSYTNAKDLTNMLKTPVMDLPSGKNMQLTFWYKNPTGGDFSVCISNDGGTTYSTELATGLTGASVWTKKEIVLPAGFTKNVVIVFKGTSNYGSGDAYIYLDDVTIDEAPTCIVPTGLAADNATANSVELSWTNGSDEEAWQIVYGTTADFDADAATPVDVNTNPFTLTGLSAETTYYVCIRSKKDADVSVWSYKVNFTTMPSCITPTDFAVSAITINSATLTWTDATEQSKWEVSYSTTSGTPNDGTIVAVTEKNCTIEGLTAGATYYASVRAVNSDDDKSAWSSEVSFTPGVVIANEGRATSNCVPVYGNYTDESNNHSQFIIPSTSLTNLNDKQIDKIIFYSSSATKSWGNAKFDVYLQEVENTTFSSTTLASWDDMMKVYSGQLSVVDNQMVIELVTPFEYNGGNLMVGIYQTTPGTGSPLSWYGVSTSEYTAISNKANTKRQKFLPKTAFYYSPIPIAPKMVVSETVLAYGPVAPNSVQTKTFTIENKGKADMTGITVSCNNPAFTVTEVQNQTIAVGGEAITVTVTFNTEIAGEQNGTITISATEQDDATIVVSGAVRDANKLYIDFADGMIPSGWTSAAIGSYSSGWTEKTGYVQHSGSYSYNESALQSPKLTFTEGETVFFKTAKYGNYSTPSIKVEYSIDGSTWTTIGSAFTDDIYGTWTQRSVVIPTADVQYIRFSGWYVRLTEIYGGELPSEPIMDFSASDYNFGMITTATTTTAYTVKNIGKAALTGLNVTSDNDNFTVAVTDNATSIAANSEVTFTVTMKADVKGAQSGKITVSADGFENVEFNVSGWVVDNDAILIDFADNDFPAGWENSGWTVANQTATGSWNSVTSRNSEVVSPGITIADGQSLAIEAKGNGSYAELYVYTSADNGESWTKVVDFNTEMRANTSDYTIVTVSGVPAGNYKLKIEGYSVTVNTINGYTYNLSAPELTVSPATDADFGTKIKAQPVAKTYTITNSGTGTLTGTITSSTTDDFIVSESSFSLGAGESMTFDIILVFDTNYGAKGSTITIHPTVDGLSDVIIYATGVTADPNIWEEDFEDGISATWINNGWVASNSGYGNNGTYMAFAGSNNANTLITPRLQASAAQVLTFEIGGADATDKLTVEYSNDRNTWTAIEGSPFSTTGQQTFTAPADGYYYLRFSGRYCSVDNFYGFKEAPLAHDATITATSIPTTGNQYVEYTATVTVNEMAGKAEELTAKFFIGENQYGEDVVATVEANGTKTFTVTFTPENDVNGEAYFTLSNADLSLISNKVNVTIAPAMVLDQTVAPELTDGTAASVVVNYTAKSGWNTICMPFALTTDDMTAIFGENWKAYEFKSYANGELGFSATTTFYAGYPYIVYSETPVNTQLKKQNVTIDATANSDEHGDVTFQGTYAPMSAGTLTDKYGVTSNSKIQKCGDKVTMKGFRAYFEVASGVSVKGISFFDDDATGIRFISADGTVEDGQLYDLNGRRVQTTQPHGVYILNGKKLYFK